jgi:hypothetical protein
VSLLLVSTACWVHTALGACASPTKVIHFVHLCALHTASLPFLNESLRPTYFLPTAAKSRQKGPLEGNALHPIIFCIKQVVCTCSQQWQTQLASLLIALLNSQNNRRALSRGEVKRKDKSIGVAAWGNRQLCPRRFQFLYTFMVSNPYICKITDNCRILQRGKLKF